MIKKIVILFVFLLIISAAILIIVQASKDKDIETAVILSKTPQPTQTAETTTAVSASTSKNRLTNEESRELLENLADPDEEEGLAALAKVAESGDTRFIPVLIELYRAGQIGIIPWGTQPELIDTLESLSGQSFGFSWPAWIEWYGGTDIAPPDGFTSWKGKLLSRIDPRFPDFFQDSYPSDIRVEEILWGGVVLDGIPALDHAEQIPANQAGYLDPDDPIFGMSINGDNRAYPMRIMDWHEMANDTIGGVPVSIAYCTLCGAAVAYDGRASDGVTYDFGSSGFLFRSNKLMYDRQTMTLWNQLTGQPVLGELVGQEVTLKVLPIVLTTWEDWQSQHPDTTVLSLDTGFNRDYTLGAAYGDYFAASGTMFPVWQRSDLLPAKSQIYALRINGFPKAYPLDRLVAEQVSNDNLGGTDLVLVTSGEIIEADGDNWRVGRVTYNTGAQVRAYKRGTHTFAPDDTGGSVVDETGAVWQVTEESLISPSGEELPRLGGHLAYWFGWFAFFPGTTVYGE